MNGTTTPAWVNVRKTNNFNTQAPVTDVTSPDFRCYDSQTDATATTITVAAGSQMGIMSDGTIYHPGVVNVYMAKAPGDVGSFAGDGDVWFKVYQISAVTNGGQSISFPAEGVPGVTFTLPSALPSGQYLVRMEAIALHVAQTFGGAQFYVSPALCRVSRVVVFLTALYARFLAARSTSSTVATARPAPLSPSPAFTLVMCVLIQISCLLADPNTLCLQEPGILININVSTRPLTRALAKLTGTSCSTPSPRTTLSPAPLSGPGEENDACVLRLQFVVYRTYPFRAILQASVQRSTSSARRVTAPHLNPTISFNSTTRMRRGILQRRPDPRRNISCAAFSKSFLACASRRICDRRHALDPAHENIKDARDVASLDDPSPVHAQSAAVPAQ